MKKFEKILIRKEYNALKGGGVPLVILSVTLLTTFFLTTISVNISNGLKEKMESPFIKFVKVPTSMNSVGRNKTDSIIRADLNEQKIKNRFGLNDKTPIFGVHTTYFPFQSYSGKNIDAGIRRIESDGDDPFYKFLIDNQNDIFVEGLKRVNLFEIDPVTDESKRWGLIVTESYLNRLGFNITAPPAYISYSYDGENTLIPFPLSGVVKTLPDEMDVLATENIFNSLQEVGDVDLEENTHAEYIKIFVSNKAYTGQEKEILELGFHKIENHPQESIVNGIYLICNDFDDKDKIIEDLNKKKIDYYTVFNFTKSRKIYDRPADEYNAVFNQFDSIRQFRDYVKNKFKLSVNLQTIENKSNFQIFHIASIILRISLLVLGVFLVIVFTNNMISNHIDKNKKNLGTLKSFGLSNNEITRIYSFVALKLVFLSLVLAIVSNSILQHLIGSSFLGLIGLVDVKERTIFMDPVILFFLIAILVVSVIIIVRNQLLNKTPGDLIYGRI
jgi:ABC-type antimicrobial peptide transport system permease subunit